jgi:methyl-accepting chemotaxis protein
MAKENHQVNVNEADVDDLKNVGKLGPVLAERIIAARPFETVDDLQRVNGIGPKLLDQIRPYLSVTTPSTILQSEPIQTEEIESEMPLLVQDDPLVQEEPLLQDEQAETADIKETLETAEDAEPVFAREPEEEAAAAEPLQPLPEAPAVKEDSLELPAEKPVEAATGKKEPVVVVGKDTESIFYPNEEPPETSLKKDEQVRAIQVVDDSSQQQPAKEQHKTQSKPGLKRGEMLAWTLGGSLVSLILGVLITLGILAIINGSLRYRTEQQAVNTTAALQSRLDAVGTQIEDANTEITGLRTRLNAVEALSGRVSTLETDTADLQTELADTTESVNSVISQLGDITDEMSQITEELTALQESTNLFQNFLQQLQGLLNGLFPIDSGGVQP